MKHVETMDHLENNNDIIIILTSYPPLQEKFKARLDIEKTKKESDYAKSRELKKSEIATLNYFIVKNST
ncbi:MAG TPA: hypothetical protein VHA09_06790 [Nitrososphaera sp.]|nr:hypothetical protein [Nitrososphaera sp.]